MAHMLLSRLDKLLSGVSRNLNAAIYNVDGKILPLLPSLDDIAYYDPDDIDPISLMPLGEDPNDPVVYYRGRQTVFRAHKRSSLVFMMQRNIFVEPETREVMCTGRWEFDPVNFINLTALPLNARTHNPLDDSSETTTPLIPVPWDGMVDLVPLMTAVAHARYGQDEPTLLLNIFQYTDQVSKISENFPPHSLFYIHVRDESIQECSEEKIRFRSRMHKPVLTLCCVNGRRVECVCVECMPNDSHILVLKIDGLRNPFQLTKTSDGFYFRGQHFPDIQTLCQRISLSLEYVRVDENGRNVDVDDGGGR